MTPLALDLAGRGIAAWNVEYPARRSGGRRVARHARGRRCGARPARPTLDDVDPAASWSRAATPPAVTSPCGSRPAPRSPGGARWAEPARAAGRGDRPGRRARPPAAGTRKGSAAARLRALLGARRRSERFAAASPAALAPLGVPQLLVHGTRRRHRARGAEPRSTPSSTPVRELVELEGADHFDVIDPAHGAWDAVVEWLPHALARHA